MRATLFIEKWTNLRTMKYFLFAVKLLRREWRAGELFTIFFALVISITVLTSLHFYTDHLKQGFYHQASAFLGGDLVVSSSMPIPDKWKAQVKKLQMEQAEVWLFPTMAIANNKLQLVNLQAVSENYPLFKKEKSFPRIGTVWIDERLLSLLSIQISEFINLGAAKFRIEKILGHEINTISNGLFIAPKLVINLNDIPQTQTVLPGSRVEYRLLVSGNPTQLKNLLTWLKPQLNPGQRLIDLKSQNAALNSTLEDAQDYLSLVVLVSLLLNGIAIGLAAYRFSQRHQKFIALWRCWGISRKQILWIYFWQLFYLSIIAGTIGTGFGYIGQSLLIYLFADWFAFPFSSPNLFTFFLGPLISMIILFGFAFPAFIGLSRISPLKIFQQAVVATSLSLILMTLFLILSLILLLLTLTQHLLLTLLLLNALIVTAGFLYCLSLLLLQTIYVYRQWFTGAIRQGALSLYRNAHSTCLQITSFGLIIALVMLLAILQSDLINSWRLQLPMYAPNYFVINIDPLQVSDFEKMLHEQQIKIEGIYPIVRGRLIEKNNRSIAEAVPPSAQQNNVLRRELNLSWMNNLPFDNHIIEGKWWNKEDTGKLLVSVEADLAKKLNFKLGDKLTFQIGDMQLQANICSFRTLKWGTFQPNFYMIFPPGVLNNMPATYMTSFYLPPEKISVLNNLNFRFPNATVIDVSYLLSQSQQLTKQMAFAIHYLFLFVLFAGLIVFYISLKNNMDARLMENALLRTLGVGQRFIRISLITEFLLMGLLAGIIGATGAMGIAYYLAIYILKITYEMNFYWWFIGAGVGVICVTLPGLWMINDVFRSSPLRLWRVNN